jgi:hypothetical protein
MILAFIYLLAAPVLAAAAIDLPSPGADGKYELSVPGLRAKVRNIELQGFHNSRANSPLVHPICCVYRKPLGRR